MVSQILKGVGHISDEVANWLKANILETQNNSKQLDIIIPCSSLSLHPTPPPPVVLPPAPNVNCVVFPTVVNNHDLMINYNRATNTHVRITIYMQMCNYSGFTLKYTIFTLAAVFVLPCMQKLICPFIFYNIYLT